MQIHVGNWKVEVSTGGHPCWVTIGNLNGSMLTGFDHRQLRDLEYAIGRAIKAVRDDLPDNYKHEMD